MPRLCNKNCFKVSIMKKIKIGDAISSKHGVSVINGIEIVEPGEKDGGLQVLWVWECDKDRCVFDLANGHWAYGDECSIINQSIEA